MAVFADAESFLSLDDAKLHLRVDHDYEDTLIQAYRDAAVQDVAAYLRRNIVARNVDDVYSRREVSDDGSQIRLRHGDITTPANVQVFNFNEDGSQNELDTSTFFIDSPTEHAVLVFTETPTYQYEHPSLLRITYQSGLDSGHHSIPAVKSAVLLTLGTLYEHRETQVVGANSTELPMSVQYLCSPYRYFQV